MDRIQHELREAKATRRRHHKKQRTAALKRRARRQHRRLARQYAEERLRLIDNERHTDEVISAVPRFITIGYATQSEPKVIEHTCVFSAFVMQDDE